MSDQERHDFAKALRLLRHGGRLARVSWGDESRPEQAVKWVQAFVPATVVTEGMRPLGVEPSEIISSTPHVRLMGPRKQDESIVDWIPTHADLLAGDWTSFLPLA